MVLMVRRLDRRALLAEEPGLPSWLVWDLVNRGVSRVGYMATLLKDHPDVKVHPDLGLVDISELPEHGIDLGTTVLKGLSLHDGGGFVYAKEPRYCRNDLLVASELENAVFGVYLRSRDPALLERLDETLAHFDLTHTDRWPLYLSRAGKEFARHAKDPDLTEMTLTEPLPINLRAKTSGESKGPLLRLVESLVHGYLSYLPDRVKEQFLETGCAFVPDMRLLLKQFPQLALDQNVLKVDLFAGRNGRTYSNRAAVRLLGLESHNGWILIRDAQRQIEHNLSEALKRRFESHIQAQHARVPSTVEKVMLSTLLNENGVGCTFDKDNRRSRKLNWTTVFLGTERRVLGDATLEQLGVDGSE